LDALALCEHSTGTQILEDLRPETTNEAGKDMDGIIIRLLLSITSLINKIQNILNDHLCHSSLEQILYLLDTLLISILSIITDKKNMVQTLLLLMVLMALMALIIIMVLTILITNISTTIITVDIIGGENSLTGGIIAIIGTATTLMLNTVLSLTDLSITEPILLMATILRNTTSRTSGRFSSRSNCFTTVCLIAKMSLFRRM